MKNVKTTKITAGGACVVKGTRHCVSPEAKAPAYPIHHARKDLNVFHTPFRPTKNALFSGGDVSDKYTGATG